MRRALFVLLFAGCAAPRETVYERPIDDAIEEGVDYLVRTQSPDGSWGRGLETTDFDVMASVPGSHDAFRVGTTALCIRALRETGEKKASARGLQYLATYDGVRRANRMEIYNVWAHVYALETLARAWAEDKVEAYRKGAQWHLKRLEMYETYVGGWNYYDFIYGTEKPSMEPTSFGTAAGLVALYEAKKAGIAVPEGLVRRALARLKEMKNPDGSFLYGSDFRYVPRHLANRDKGSLGRTQSCYYALKLWNEGGVGEPQIREGLERLFREHRFIEIGRKRPMPHEAWYFTAGYYYYFGHYYAAKLIEGLADKRDYRDQLRSFVLPHQEPDGSWWDFHLYDYGKPWGTSFAILTLLRCK
jgi:Prenyltransferase and squalene oxidase repeat